MRRERLWLLIALCLATRASTDAAMTGKALRAGRAASRRTVRVRNRAAMCRAPSMTCRHRAP